MDASTFDDQESNIERCLQFKTLFSMQTELSLKADTLRFLSSKSYNSLHERLKADTDFT